MEINPADTYIGPLIDPTHYGVVVNGGLARVASVADLAALIFRDWAPPTLYARMVAAGVPIESHESDLYVPINLETTDILRQHYGETTWRHHSQAVSFRSPLDGKLWYDIPFAYLPFWLNRSAR